MFLHISDFKAHSGTLFLHRFLVFSHHKFIYILVPVVFSLLPKALVKMRLDLTVMSKEYCRLFVESLLLQKEHISALCPFASPALPKLSNFLRILFN